MAYHDLDGEASLLADSSKTDDVGFPFWAQLWLVSFKRHIDSILYRVYKFFYSICVLQCLPSVKW